MQTPVPQTVAEKEPPAAAAAPTPPKRRGGVPWALLVALLALGFVAWNWWDTRQQVKAARQELATRLAEADARVKQNSGLASQASENTQQLQTKLGALEAKMAESQNQQVALEALYQELSRSKDDWSLTEIEQILNIANQQLQIAGNVSAALVALQAADTRLQRLEKPQLAGLRRTIDQDIQRLKALPFVDFVGISVKLDNMILAVEVLPLLADSRPSDVEPGQAVAPVPTGFWKRLAYATWGEIKNVIRIQRLESSEPPLLSPNQSFFLRENLKLRLLSARLALLAHDETSYRADLNAAREWLSRYFDPKSKGVQNATGTLGQLADGAITIDIPDISASIDAVRELKQGKDSPAQ
jgi:uroporphyrin-III C-methyltransferase